MGEIRTGESAFAGIQMTATVVCTVFFVYVSVVCEDVLGELTALLEALSDTSTTALVGSVDPALCETVAKVATHRTKSFITWSCPQVHFLLA